MNAFPHRAPPDHEHGRLQRAIVLVLGDVGRSPRAQLHALSLAACCEEVWLVGYGDSEPFDELVRHPRIRIVQLEAPSPLASASAVDLARAVAGRAFHTTRLLHALFRLPPADLLLTQTPPALPTFLIAPLLRAVRARFWICDWHNLSHAVLALKLGAAHPAVRAWRALEQRLGRLAGAHICVSEALARSLSAELGVAAPLVLHDRPVPAPVAGAGDRAALLARLFGGAQPEEPRLLLVSATSWSLDEDFDLLCDALASLPAKLPAALDLVITGKGPERARHLARLRALERPDLRIAAPFLPSTAYRKLLASADLGLCLHRSATGLDLPMKIADMLGAGVPVCALDYGPVLREQLPDGAGAPLFTDAPALGALLVSLLEDFARGGRELARLRRALAARCEPDWHEHWRERMTPLLAQLTAPAPGLERTSFVTAAAR